jgi:hypothetical protein
MYNYEQKISETGCRSVPNSVLHEKCEYAALQFLHFYISGEGIARKLFICECFPVIL